jgi:hypothetical protein
MHDMTGTEKSAMRLSLWNKHDLSTNDGVRSILDKIDVLKPSHVWLSMECGPYSVMQNINQRNPEQKAELERKRREVLKQYVGVPLCSVIAFKGAYMRHGNGHSLVKLGDFPW